MEEHDQSEFNYGISFLNRLNAWFYLAGECSYNLDAAGWFHALLSIYREVSDDMKPDEIFQSETQKDSINKQVNIFSHIKRRHDNISIPTELYNSLHNYEIFLRKIIKGCGYKTKMKDDPRFSR